MKCVSKERKAGDEKFDPDFGRICCSAFLSLRNRIRAKKLFFPFHSSLMSDEPSFQSERNEKSDCICTEKFLFQQNDYGMYVSSNIMSNNMNRIER